jgi:hypothetical protein
MAPDCRFYEIDAVMSPSKKSQKSNLSRRSRGFFKIFNENEQITTNTTTADPSVAALASPNVVAAEAVILREQIALSRATIYTKSAESEYEIDTPLLGEKAPPASPVVTVTTDTDATISDFDLDDEEAASDRDTSEHVTLASVESIVEMGFDRMDVLLALSVAKCNEDLAVEYLVSGIPQGASAEVDLGGNASVTPDEENTDEDGDEEGLSQEMREQLVIQRTQSKGFSEEEVANILQIFRQDRMAALDIELAGPVSAWAAAPAGQALPGAVRVSPRRALTLQLSPMRRASMINSNPSSTDISIQARDLTSQSGVSTPDYISPYTNAYLAISLPNDPELTTQAPRNESLQRPLDTSIGPKLTNQVPRNESLQRPLDTSIDTAPRRKKQKKRPRAPTPPRYRGLTREEYMKRRFGDDSDGEDT